MKIQNLLAVWVVALLVGTFSLCSACDDCSWNEVKKEVKEEKEVAKGEEAKVEVKEEVKAEPVVEIAANTEANDEEDEFDPEAFAQFAQRLREGDVDTSVQVVEEKDTV